MTWQGIRRDLDSVGDGAALAVNTRYYIDGELRRRPGMVRSLTVAGQMLALRFAADNATVMVMLRSNGNLESQAPA